MSNRPEPPEAPAQPLNPWYAEGLEFDCKGCGACCLVEGYVWVDRKEIRAIAEFLDLEPDDFGRRYLRSVGRRMALTEKSNHGCIFWDNGCSIYQARPSQCRTFPFWPEALKSPASWKREGKLCHGIDQGRLYSLGEIAELQKGRGQTTSTDPSSPCSGCGCESDSEPTS